MTNKPMLSVERELRTLAEKACGTAKDSPEYRRFLEAVTPTIVLDLIAEPAAQHPGDPVMPGSEEFSHMSTIELRGYHAGWHAACMQNSSAEKPAPVADHPQCEECKGWGYHENHHEGGGTECGECGGSGNASVAVVMVIPDRVEVEPFTTIDRGSKSYKAGYNAAISEVAKLNGLKP